MNRVIVNDSRAPLVIVRFTGEPDDNDIIEMLKHSEAAFESGEQYALVMDDMGISTLSSGQRRLFAEWMKRNSEPLSRLCVGQAFAIRSLLTRGIIRSVMALQPPPCAWSVHASVGSAKAWCCKRLRQAGLHVPRITEEFPEGALKRKAS